MKFKILTIIAVVLIAAISLSSALFVYNGGVADLIKDRNEDNLIQMDTSYVKDHDTNRGVKIDVNDKGVIKLSGKATSDYDVKIASVKLPAGTYTVSSGMDETDINRLWMYVQHSGGQAIAGTEGATFTLNAEETVTVSLSWSEDYRFNAFTENKIYPVIVEGNSIGDFYG